MQSRVGVFVKAKVEKNNPLLYFIPSLQVSCKVLHFFHMYMLGCNYFWMLCEGIYLHTLIVVAVFAEEQHLHWYYLLGWGEFWCVCVGMCVYKVRCCDINADRKLS